MNNVAATFAMGINNPTPALRNGAAIAPRPASSTELVSMISQYFIGGMMPDPANPVQQSVTVIEIRPFKGGWQCYEGEGVGPCWIGDTAKQSATDYAKARAKFGRGEIRVLRQDGSVESVIRI